MSEAAGASGAAAQVAAAHAARTAYARLLSWLAWQWRDVAAAEDALGDALLKALELWPLQGVPAAPDAWLLTVAKRQLLQVARHQRVQSDPAVMAVLAPELLQADAPLIPDQRLRLMLVCAHPAIDEKIRVALMLQTTLGLQASEIAGLMLMSPAGLAQRLVRAKQKIAAAGIRFEEPEAEDLPQRLHYVLEAIYAIYSLGAEVLDSAQTKPQGGRSEARYLAQLVCQLLGDGQRQSAEALGLLALIGFCEARRDARLSAAGEFVPLTEQDTSLWQRDLIGQADHLLMQAARLRQPGYFQLEAAVQSAHAQRLFTGHTPWAAISTLYAHINQHFPSLGSQVAGAVALAETGAWAAALAQLEALPSGLPASQVASYQPWQVARAHMLAMLGQTAAARDAYACAIGLSEQPAIRAHLLRRQTQLESAPE